MELAIKKSDEDRKKEHLDAEKAKQDLKEVQRHCKKLEENSRFNEIRDKLLTALCGLPLVFYRTQLRSIKEHRRKAKQLALKCRSGAH